MKTLLATLAIALSIGNWAHAQDATCNPMVETCYSYDEGYNPGSDDYYNDDYGYYDYDFNDDYGYGYGNTFGGWNYNRLFFDVYGNTLRRNGEYYDIVDWKLGDTTWTTGSRGHLIAKDFVQPYRAFTYNSEQRFYRSGSQNSFRGTIGIPIYPVYEQYVCTRYKTRTVCPSDNTGGDDSYGLGDEESSEGDDTYGLDEESSEGDDIYGTDEESTSTSADECTVEETNECADGYYGEHASSTPLDWMAIYVNVSIDGQSDLRPGETENIALYWRDGILAPEVNNAWNNYTVDNVFVLPTQFLGFDTQLQIDPFRINDPFSRAVDLRMHAVGRKLRNPPMSAVEVTKFDKSTPDANGELIVGLHDTSLVSGETTSFEVELRMNKTFADASCFKQVIPSQGANTEINLSQIAAQVQSECVDGGKLKDGAVYHADIRVKRVGNSYAQGFSDDKASTINLTWSTTGAAQEKKSCAVSSTGESTNGLGFMLFALSTLFFMRRKQAE